MTPVRILTTADLVRLEAEVARLAPDFADFAMALARLESPSDRADLQAPVFDLLTGRLEATGFSVARFPGRRSGGQLLARRENRKRPCAFQLLLGHSDTVWPVSTVDAMPVSIEGGVLRGPGTFDMKAGLAMALTAFEALRGAGLEPSVEPVLFVNSDEEIDSTESREAILRLSRRADRVLVLEPGLGTTGRFKSSRPGTALYQVTVQGRSSHAGLAPGDGRSAILGMTDLVRTLETLHDPERGVLINIGTVEGGTRRNVVPALCRFSVDVRTRTRDDAERLDTELRALTAPREGLAVHVTGSIERPPFEGLAARHRPLLDRALFLAESVGLEAGHAYAGGASDGNFAAGLAPTLDGLGAVGDGAHAAHEHVLVDPTVRRILLLALLLLEPPVRTAQP